MKNRDMIGLSFIIIILLIALLGVSIQYQTDINESFDNGNYNAQNQIVQSCNQLKSFYINDVAYKCFPLRRPELR